MSPELTDVLGKTHGACLSSLAAAGAFRPSLAPFRSCVAPAAYCEITTDARSVLRADDSSASPLRSARPGPSTASTPSSPVRGFVGLACTSFVQLTGCMLGTSALNRLWRVPLRSRHLASLGRVSRPPLNRARPLSSLTLTALVPQRRRHPHHGFSVRRADSRFAAEARLTSSCSPRSITYLRQAIKSDYQHSSPIVDRIIRCTVETNGITAVFAIIDAALFVALPQDSWVRRPLLVSLPKSASTSELTRLFTSRSMSSPT